MRVCHINFNRKSFNGAWLTASLLSSPGLFWAFLPILTVLYFVWFRFVFWSSVSTVPTTTDISFMFHMSCQLSGKMQVFVFLSIYFFFCTPRSAVTAESSGLQVIFFLLINNKSSLLPGIEWSVYSRKFQRILCVSFSRTGSGLCIHFQISISYTIPARSHFTFSCSFCANLRHSLIVWLTVSSLLLHNRHLIIRMRIRIINFCFFFLSFFLSFFFFLNVILVYLFDLLFLFNSNFQT